MRRHARNRLSLTSPTISRAVFGFALMLAMSCGPVEDPNGWMGDPGETQADAGGPPPPGEAASISGTVWAPGQAPDMVPANHEIPIFNALVTVSPFKLAPIPQETYCERCVNPSGTYTFTDHQGNFQIEGILPGTYWLTIQKGQFRLEREIVLGAGQPLALPDDFTTLPSSHDPSNGKWIPRIAMAVGTYDHLEDILGKMGLGTVDATGRYVSSSANGVMDVYTNGTSFNGDVAGTLGQLVSNPAQLNQYHILFIPCSNASEVSALSDQQNLRNIQDFVAAGGKLYVTDWSGEWHDNVFPAQVTLGGGVDTPASAYDPATMMWNTGAFGTADGASYDSENAEVVDTDLNQWLGFQNGPVVDGYNGTFDYDPNEFTIEGNWNYISSLNDVYLGDNNEGMAVYDVPRAYIIGGEGTSTPKRPLTVTYEPGGCGRVLYSTYHTTDNTHNGLVPQERVLLYLIMEIGVCQSGPIIE